MVFLYKIDSNYSKDIEVMDEDKVRYSITKKEEDYRLEFSSVEDCIEYMETLNEEEIEDFFKNPIVNFTNTDLDNIYEKIQNKYKKNDYFKNCANIKFCAPEEKPTFDQNDLKGNKKIYIKDGLNSSIEDANFKIPGSRVYDLVEEDMTLAD